MSKQPEATRLAEKLFVRQVPGTQTRIDAAIELHRQHALIEELRGALDDLLQEVVLAGLGDAKDYGWPVVTAAARAVLAKAEAQQ